MASKRTHPARHSPGSPGKQPVEDRRRIPGIHSRAATGRRTSTIIAPAFADELAREGDRLTTVELGWLGLLVALGILLRLGSPLAATVEHFDEGVYASNLWFAADAGHQYPFRHLYAPPLLPALIEFTLTVQQFLDGSVWGAGMAALLPSLLLGCITPILVWWVAKSWFGREAAWGATSLASLNEFHAFFSRTALTDAVLLFWILLAMQAAHRALVGRDRRWAIAAGVFAGLAWQTKYNGWLPILFVLTAIVGRALFCPTARPALRRDLALWCLMGVTATAFWGPVWWWLQPYGGYSAVAANHRTYLVGLEGWLGSFLEQAAKLRYFDGWLGCLTPGLAWILTGLAVIRRREWSPAFAASRESVPGGVGGQRPPGWLLASLALGASCTGLIAASAWVGSVGVSVLLMSLAILSSVVERVRSRPPIQAAKSAVPDTESAALPTDTQQVAIWLGAAWFFTLLVLTPFYWPYPRLSLPWVASCWFGAGWAMARLVSAWSGPAFVARSMAPNRQAFVGAVLLAASLVAVLPQAARLTSRGMIVWQDRTGLAQVAQHVTSHLSKESAVVLVYGEPALFFQLRARGVSCLPTADPNFVPRGLPAGVSLYLVSGWHASATASDPFLSSPVAEHWREVAQIPYPLSDLVVTDRRHFASSLTADATRAKARLFQLRPSITP